MRRLYYMTSDIEETEKISRDLHQKGITDWHFHVLSKDEAGLRQHHVHSANMLQQLDIIHTGERGALLAFPIGLAVAIIFASTSPFGQEIPLVTMALITVVITLFGAWVGGMAGLLRDNYKVARFHKKIQNGQNLIMIDIKKNHVKEFKKMMQESYPNVEMAGEDSTFINPFKSSYHHA